MKNLKSVIKHSSATQISNDISSLQRRAWNALLANAYDDLPLKETYSIPIKDLASILDYGSNDIDYLKETIRNLNTTQVEWNILDKDSQHWGVFTLLSEASIKDGICTYAYTPYLKERLHNPNMYAKISLSLQNKFDSRHTLALYELFLDYFNVRKGYGETPFITIENFRKLLGLKEDQYPQYKILNRDLIKKSMKEINKKSDILVEARLQKEARKVVALKFIIKKNVKYLTDIKPISTSKNKDLKDKNQSDPEFDKNMKSIIDLIPEKHREEKPVIYIISKYLESHNYEYVKRNVDYTNTRADKNYYGYLYKALKNDWGLGPKEVQIQNVESNEKLQNLLNLVLEQHRKKKVIQKLIAKCLKNYDYDYIKHNIEYTNLKITDHRKYRAFLENAIKNDLRLQNDEIQNRVKSSVAVV